MERTRRRSLQSRKKGDEITRGRKKNFPTGSEQRKVDERQGCSQLQGNVVCKENDDGNENKKRRLVLMQYDVVSEPIKQLNEITKQGMSGIKEQNQARVEIKRNECIGVRTHYVFTTAPLPGPPFQNFHFV